MKIHHEVSPLLLTPKINQFINSYVAKFHKNKLLSADLPSLVGELCGYELINTKLNCGGYCDGNNGLIALGKSKHPYKTIFHEMGHAMQFELEMFEKSSGLISDELKKEWQAETIAYEMYRRCFGDAHTDKRKFDAYFTKRDWLFLIDWYGSWRQNDMEIYLL